MINNQIQPASSTKQNSLGLVKILKSEYNGVKKKWGFDSIEQSWTCIGHTFELDI